MSGRQSSLVLQRNHGWALKASHILVSQPMFWRHCAVTGTCSSQWTLRVECWSSPSCSTRFGGLKMLGWVSTRWPFSIMSAITWWSSPSPRLAFLFLATQLATTKSLSVVYKENSSFVTLWLFISLLRRLLLIMMMMPKNKPLTV